MQDLPLLAPILPYFTYSKQLRDKQPLVAYSCEWYGVSLGLKTIQQANPI